MALLVPENFSIITQKNVSVKFGFPGEIFGFLSDFVGFLSENDKVLCSPNGEFRYSL